MVTISAGLLSALYFVMALLVLLFIYAYLRTRFDTIFSVEHAYIDPNGAEHARTVTLQNTTTSTVSKVLTINGTDQTTVENVPSIPLGYSKYTVDVTAWSSGSYQSQVKTVYVKRTSSSASIVLQPATITDGSAEPWTVVASAGNSNQSLFLTVTGAADTDISWSALCTRVTSSPV